MRIMAIVGTTDWKTLGLHHWSMLALLYATGPPVPIDGALPTLEVDVRLATVTTLLGISATVPEVRVSGPGETGSYVVNNRLIEKMRDEAYAKRTPFIPWAPHDVANAIEVWRREATP